VFVAVADPPILVYTPIHADAADELKPAPDIEGSESVVKSRTVAMYEAINFMMNRTFIGVTYSRADRTAS